MRFCFAGRTKDYMSENDDAFLMVLLSVETYLRIIMEVGPGLICPGFSLGSESDPSNETIKHHVVELLIKSNLRHNFESMRS